RLVGQPTLAVTDLDDAVDQVAELVPGWDAEEAKRAAVRTTVDEGRHLGHAVLRHHLRVRPNVVYDQADPVGELGHLLQELLSLLAVLALFAARYQDRRLLLGVELERDVAPQVLGEVVADVIPVLLRDHRQRHQAHLAACPAPARGAAPLDGESTLAVCSFPTVLPSGSGSFLTCGSGRSTRRPPGSTTSGCACSRGSGPACPASTAPSPDEVGRRRAGASTTATTAAHGSGRTSSSRVGAS